MLKLSFYNGLHGRRSSRRNAELGKFDAHHSKSIKGRESRRGKLLASSRGEGERPTDSCQSPPCTKPIACRECVPSYAYR